jgi:hypothetical protein
MRKTKPVFHMLSVLTIAVVLFSVVGRAEAAEQQVYTVSFDMSGIYAPAKFIVEFAYCHSPSGPVNMTLGGHSLWTAQISPVGFEFDAKDIDTYEFNLHLVYNATTDQVLTLSYWSGDLAPNSIRARVVGNDILIHFRMVVNTQPQIPSKEAIAEAVVVQIKQDLADYQAQVAALTYQLQESLMTMWAVVAIALFAAILSLVVAFYAIRTSHQEKRR